MGNRDSASAPAALLSREEFDELVQKSRSSATLASLAVLLAVISFAYGAVIIFWALVQLP